MKFFRKGLLNKQYEVYLSPDRQHIELHSNGQLGLSLEIQDVLNFSYFRPKQFAGNERYWLSLKTRKNGNFFFPTQFSDESFVKELIQLVPRPRLEEMRNHSLKKHLFYYFLPLVLLGIYLANLGEKKFTGLLVLGFFFFIFNSFAVYNEFAKFKKYKEMKEE